VQLTTVWAFITIKLVCSVGKSAQIPTYLYTPKGSSKMLHCQQQPYNSVWVWADSQDELGLTFMRPQEHYESTNKKFRNNIFTVGQLRNWYSETYGSNSYHTHWVGFNFPSRILTPFKQGLFDPLTIEETRLLDLFKYRNDDFYIIGAQNKNVLRHELAHALYASNPKYKLAIDNFVSKNKNKLKKTISYLTKKGYCKEVIYDEIQAYITDNEDTEIINNTCPLVISGINQIYNKYNTAKVKK